MRGGKLFKKLLRRCAILISKIGLHKTAFRLYEKFSAIKNRFAKNNLINSGDSLPVPPPELVVLVAGGAGVGWFLEFGKSMHETLLATLAKNGIPPEGLGSILEFGCGCGRVFRYWKSFNNVKLYGTDYNDRLIAWCRGNLPFAEFSVNQSRPPLRYPDGSIDFIYAISVFTHLAEELQYSWLNELNRILPPKGALIFTTHGASVRENFTAKEKDDFDSGNLVVRFKDASGMNLCSVYHPEEYVRNVLAPKTGFSVVDFIPSESIKGINQDLYLLLKNQRPPKPAE